MYLSIGNVAAKGLLFDVPHKRDPMTIKEIMKELPAFAEAMNGDGEENTLLFYYKKDKETGQYIFQDEDAEADVAEMMGVEIAMFAEEEEVVAREGLSNAQVDLHKENINMIREGLAKIG